MPDPALPLIGAEPELAPEAPDDLKLWSVTTIIGTLDKPALVPWAAIKTAEAAVDSETWKYLLENEGRQAAVDYLKQARFRTGRGLRSATELGTAVHGALEHKVLHGRFRDEDRNDLELRPFLQQINQFLKDFKPRFIASEVTVFHPRFGYAGTCDGFLEIDGTTYIYDLKTSRDSFDARGKPKTPFPEVSLQLSAYRYAECAAIWRARQAEQFKRRYYLLSPNERAMAVPVPAADHGLVLFVAPDRYALHPVRCDEEIFDLFLATIDAARFVLDVGKNVVGHPLIPPGALRDSTDPFANLPAQ
jgi:hypothetical protein